MHGGVRCQRTKAASRALVCGPECRPVSAALSRHKHWRSMTALPVVGSDCPVTGQPLALMAQPNEYAVNRAVGPATCLGGGQGDRPTRATYQLTLRILCLLLSNDSLAI